VPKVKADAKELVPTVAMRAAAAAAFMNLTNLLELALNLKKVADDEDDEPRKANKVAASTPVHTECR
jgi:hypothetical protein